jgi:transcriptional regulator with XRE-family HTH domain
VRRNGQPAVRDRIHTARAQRRWTQARLAEALGVSASTISKWERGVTQPDPAQRAALARLFVRPADWLEARHVPTPAARLRALQQQIDGTLARLQDELAALRDVVESEIAELERELAPAARRAA